MFELLEDTGVRDMCLNCNQPIKKYRSASGELWTHDRDGGNGRICLPYSEIQVSSAHRCTSTFYAPDDRNVWVGAQCGLSMGHEGAHGTGLPTYHGRKHLMSQDSQPKFRSGDVVSYVPAERGTDRWWYREGTAVCREDGRLVDTYWGSGSDNHVLSDAEALTAELKFNLDDYDALPTYPRSTSHEKWRQYAPADRGRIPQHGLEALYFTRKGATESLETKIANAREHLEESQSNLRSAQWKVEWAERELAKLTSESPASPVGASLESSSRG